MRIELVYTPGCSTARKTLDMLETVIAEEQLPIPIELVERMEGAPIVRINGSELLSASNHEHIRSNISACWTELTAPIVFGTTLRC